MRLTRLRIAAFIALFAFSFVTPIGVEALEFATRVTLHGEVESGTVHEAVGDPEHFCSALFHSCACHASSALPVIVYVAFDGRPVERQVGLANFFLAALLSRDRDAPPLPPPLA